MPTSLSSRLPTRVIYRLLLREASYLPPLCQSYAKDQIRTRFRKHIYDPVDDPHTKVRVRKAQHDLRHLWAANHGMVDNMFRILMRTYGRVGKRRRDLIHNLLRPEPPADSEELAQQIEQQRRQDAEDPSQGDKKLPPDWLDKWNTDKLLALAASQARQSFWSPKAELKKRADPEAAIPEKNVWDRPLPAKLKKSKLRKEYKTLIEKVMPPVGRDEWETLRLLATGEADKSLWQMPARRPLAQSPPGISHEETGDAAAAEDGSSSSSRDKAWNWKAYATQAVRHIERGSSRSQKGRTGEQGEAPYGLGAPIGMRNYDRTRLWKRLYAKIWAMTPVMEKTAGTKTGWQVEWGRVKREVPVATLAQMDWFEGAEPAKVLSGRKKKRLATAKMPS